MLRFLLHVLLGFAAGGIRARSLAAYLHSKVGNAGKGSVFSALQSAGARRKASPVRATPAVR